MSPPSDRLRTRRVLGLRAIFYFYRRRLRAHGTQELLAAIGIAAAVALVLAAGVAQSSIAGSTRKVVRAVIGPANLQMRARGPSGFPESMLARVERIDGVRRAAPLLERSIRVVSANGRSASLYIAGTDTSLAVLNGLGRTLPLSAFAPGTIALSSSSGRVLGLSARAAGHTDVTLLIGGRRAPVRLSALLGPEEVGALAGAQVGVMPLESLQVMLGQSGRVSRILVESAPGQQASVRRRLQELSGGRLIVSGAEQDIALLDQALKPSGQASTLFAVIGALLGFLLAFNAILLTVPERRQTVADLRLSGTTRSAVVQLVSFQALCLGVTASAVGVGVGYLLSRWVFHESTGYLTEAFALSGGTVVPTRTVLAAALGGITVTWLASAFPLLDLRLSRARDAIYVQEGVPGNALTPTARRWLLVLAVALLAVAGSLYAFARSSALLASIALALATVLAVPSAFAWTLSAANALSSRAARLGTLALALGGVRGTTLRSIALAATGAVALFGSIALGGARANLIDGIHDFAHDYAADAPIWVGEPGDNQAVQQLAEDGNAAQISRISGVASVARFQGAFLTVGPRRTWVIARPAGGARSVLAGETLGGSHSALLADQRLAKNGWVAVSEQIAAEKHAKVGGRIILPTPSGNTAYRLAALTSNLAWSPGAIFMSTADFSRAWGTTAPSALAVYPAAGLSTTTVRDRIRRALSRDSGLQIASSAEREAAIDALTGEGLSQLGIVSTLLVLAAIMALAAALASSIHQRRRALAGLRLAGAPPWRLRRILLVECALMLGAGCVTGALAGVFGQFVIDAYLRQVTGFPVVGATAGARPIVIFALVLGATLAAAALPAWLASRVSPVLALVEE
jgi:putative ABC transport system permease protein